MCSEGFPSQIRLLERSMPNLGKKHNNREISVSEAIFQGFGKRRVEWKGSPLDRKEE